MELMILFLVGVLGAMIVRWIGRFAERHAPGR